MMTSFNISFPEEQSNRIVSLAAKRGFSSPNEFLEHLVSDTLNDRLEDLLEQKILEAKEEEATEWTDDDWEFIRTEGKKLAEKLRAEKR
ncbi:MAG: hypothetical protein KC940_25025 [Candidatus Omnitrophica bacterium]|nr:hypothetical protein [Candidatus Omnitrophota bacterium]MCB9783216.1 hypothetical protein [Candidatus Omnitrophota bacterium]